MKVPFRCVTVEACSTDTHLHEQRLLFFERDFPEGGVIREEFF